MTEALNTDMRQLIEAAAVNTKRLGFDLAQHATLVSMIATEVVEALECIDGTEEAGSSVELSIFTICLKSAAANFERYRKETQHHLDFSYVADQKHLDEELADIIIRVFSYVGATSRTEELLQAINRKMQANATRPPKHNKAF